MKSKQRKTPITGRPKEPVVARITKLLDVDQDLTPFVGDPKAVPSYLRDDHWFLKSPKNIGPQKLKTNTAHGRLIYMQQQFQIPRIRDTDGKLRSIARILFREIFGYDYPYTLQRSHGCDLNCVNPFHMAQPTPDVEEVPAEINSTDKEAEELADAVADFIGENGRNEAAIYAAFGLDYTEAEIAAAIRSVD